MESIKSWLINVAVAKMGPSAIRGSILGIMGFLAVKENLVPGIHTDIATHITTIQWDQLSVWLIAGLPAAGAAIIKLLQHQGQEIITKTTQGDSK